MISLLCFLYVVDAKGPVDWHAIDLDIAQSGVEYFASQAGLIEQENDSNFKKKELVKNKTIIMYS